MNYKNKLLSQHWIYIEPDFDQKYKIIVWDDGNEKYKNYSNIWSIYGVWRGKNAIINTEESSITISSISTWKLQKL